MNIFIALALIALCGAFIAFNIRGIVNDIRKKRSVNDENQDVQK